MVGEFRSRLADVASEVRRSILSDVEILPDGVSRQLPLPEPPALAGCALERRYRFIYAGPVSLTAIDDHQAKSATLAAELASARENGAPIGLRKSTSNLFRQRESTGKKYVDVRRFDRVLAIDRERMIADVEGMTTYEDLVDRSEEVV